MYTLFSSTFGSFIDSINSKLQKMNVTNVFFIFINGNSPFFIFLLYQVSNYNPTDLILLPLFLFQNHEAKSYLRLMESQRCGRLINDMDLKTMQKVGIKLNTKEWLVTYDVEKIYGSQWKTKLIVGTIVGSESQIPRGRTHHDTFIEAD